MGRMEGGRLYGGGFLWVLEVNRYEGKCSERRQGDLW